MRNLFISCFLFAFLLASCSSLANIPTPIPTSAPSGSILFQDEFESNNTGWDRASLPNGAMDYDNGVYHMFVTAPNINLWSTPNREFRDARIEVDAAKLNGPDENRIGLICRYRNGNYYFFVITSDGFYAIGKFVGGKSVLLGQNEMQNSTLIRTGVAVNHLQADCVGDTLILSINGSLAGAAKDSDLTSGGVGLLAGSFAEPNVDVIFDRYVVKQP